MAELFMLVNAPPKQLVEFKKWVNTRKYPLESRRKGFCRPYYTEARIATVKIKNDVLPQFLSELKASTQDMDIGGGNVRGVMNMGQRFINFGISIMNFYYKLRYHLSRKRVNKNTRHPADREYEKDKIRKLDMSKVEPGPDTFPGWINVKPLLFINDMVNSENEEEL